MVRRVHKYADGGKIVKVETDDGRPKVGPADPATRRKMLDKRLTETEPLKTKPPGQNTSQPQQMGVGPNTMRLLRDRGKQTNKAVDDNS